MTSRSNVLRKPKKSARARAARRVERDQPPDIVAPSPSPVAAPGSRTPQLRLDLGCGKSKCPPGPDGVPWVGVDRCGFPGVDAVVNLGRDPWPWPDGSVDEARSSHMVEHLEPAERIHFANELFRVLRPGGKCLLIAPHSSSVRAYGDLTHKWPPVCEFWLPYLNAQWRAANAPHLDAAEVGEGYTCNFYFTSGFSVRADVQVKPDEYIQFAMANYCDVKQDMIATLEKPA